MRIISRYLSREVYSATLATSVILLLIFLSNQLVRFMGYAALGSLTSSALKVIILLQIPILLAVILPAALFLGIVLAYGRLYAESEMTVLSACGFSQRQLLLVTVKIALVVVLLVGGLALWVNPTIYRYYDRLIYSSAQSNQLELIKPRHFSELTGQGWVFYVDEISADRQQFYRLFASQTRTDHLEKRRITLSAQRAVYKVERGNKSLVLYDGYRYYGVPGQRDYEVIKFGEYGVHLKEAPRPLYADESSMTNRALWRQWSPKAQAEWQWRLSLPLLAFILAWLAVPLSKVPPRHGRYFRAAPAILMYIIYVNLLLFAKSWVKRGGTSLGLWWVHILMLVVLLILWYKGDKFRTRRPSL